MHLNSNLTIPPRRWYTLAQAADKLTHDTGQKITVEDMIHFLFQGYFLPFVHVKYKLNHSLIFNGKYQIDLKQNGAKFKEVSPQFTQKFTYKDTVILNDYCKLAILGVDYPDNIKTTWLTEYFYNFLTVCGATINDEITDEMIENYLEKNKAFTIGIDGLLAVKIETLYNGDASIFEEMAIIERGLNIQNTDLMTPPMPTQTKAFTMYHLSMKEPFYIPPEDLIIVYDGLVNIANDIRANLRLVAEHMDSKGNIDESIPVYLHHNQPHFYDTPQPPKTGKAEKTIKTVKNKSNDSKENSTPRNKKDFFTPLILASIHATAQAYPHLGGYQIVNAVLDTLKDKQGFKTSDLYTVEGYLGKYKRTYNATFPRNSGRHKAQITAIITEPTD